MEILTEEEMATRLDYRRPLTTDPEPRESVWCIPFDYGGNAKGTMISISKAKEIAAELRAAVAEAEKREILRYFNREKAMAADALKQSADWQRRTYELQAEVAALRARLRSKNRRRAKAAE